MRADIQLALELVRSTQTDLTRFPKRLKVRRFRRSAVAGFYNWLTDTLHLSERYLAELDDEQAADFARCGHPRIAPRQHSAAKADA